MDEFALRDYNVELIETPTAVSAVAIQPQPSSEPGWQTLAGYTHRLDAQLAEPLGNRAFVDLSGEAMHIAPTSS